MAAMTRGKPTTPLSSILPPLIFGAGTFNTQYNDIASLDSVGLVQKALEFGIRAFDTSPYYGPSEELLGAALDTSFVHDNVPRSELVYITKCGRIRADEFDYSPEWIRQSVKRSTERLRTSYLDIVYCHDVEFVSEDEVLAAVKELRRIRDDEGTIKYIGISGYPLEVLCSLAMRILRETGEPLDVVMSYANFTLQNTTLATTGIAALKAAGVDTVPNASPLGMGLLRRQGVPLAGQGDWHPAGPGLRAAVRRASDFCDRHGEALEVVAIRYALESWMRTGESVGSRGDPASGFPWAHESNKQVGGKKLGVSVMGVSNHAELDKMMQVWRSILDGLEDGQETARRAGRWARDHEWSLNRQRAVQIMADGIQEHLAEYLDYAWESPSKEYVEKRARTLGLGLKVEEAGAALQEPWLTPAQSPRRAASEGVEEQVLPLR